MTLRTKKITQIILGGCLAAFGILAIFTSTVSIFSIPHFLSEVDLSTAILFAFSGIGIVLERYPSKFSYYLQRALGIWIILLATLFFVLASFNFSIAGSFFADHAAYTTYIAFIAVGIFLILNKKETNKLIAVVIEALIYIVGLIGLIGIISYFLKLDTLYDYFRTTAMPLSVSVGLSLIAFSLWIDLTESAFHQMWFNRQDDRISALGAVIMILIALVSSLTGFVTLQTSIEETLRSSVRQILESRLAFLKESLEQSVAKTTMIADRPILAELMFQEASKNSKEYEILRREIVSFQQEGFLAIGVYSPSGKEIFHAGNFIEHPSLKLELALPHRAYIAWDNQFLVHAEVRMFYKKKFIGTIVTEQFLPNLTSLIYDLRNMSTSGAMMICGQNSTTTIQCFPSKFDSPPVVVAKQNPSYIPIRKALDNETGIYHAESSIWSNRISAYGPIRGLGMGAVLQVSTQELYQPISKELPNLVMLILFIIGGGTILLRSQIKPLATAIITDAMRTKAIVGNVGDGIITLDHNGNIESFNAAAAHIFGYDPNDVQGKNIKLLLSPDTNAEQISLFDAENLLSDKSVNLELPARTNREELIWTSWVLSKILFGTEKGIVAIVRDISQEKIVKERLTYAATYDALTCVANRVLFNDRLSQAISRCRRQRTQIAILYLDIDKFKEVNDQHGHQVGDELLRKFAARLIDKIRTNDTVARLGGDEFAIIIEDLHKNEHAVTVAEKIIQDVRHVFHISIDNGKSLKLFTTTSIGIAYYNPDDNDNEQLLNHADRALYQAKANGRNRYQIYDGETE